MHHNTTPLPQLLTASHVSQDVSDDYSPGDDSEDEAPKKKKNTAASKGPKGKAAAGGGSAQPQQVPEKVAKAAATALRSIKSNISAQMVYKKSLKRECHHSSSVVKQRAPPHASELPSCSDSSSVPSDHYQLRACSEVPSVAHAWSAYSLPYAANPASTLAPQLHGAG